MGTRYFKDVIFISIIVLLIGIILLFVSYVVEQTLTKDSLLVHVLRDIGILLSSIGVISILYETLIRRQLLVDYSEELRKIVDPDTRKLGIAALFKDRNDRMDKGYLIAKLVKSTREEMCCLGLGLLQFLPEHQALIKQRIKDDGCSFKFLIYRPDAPTCDALDQSLGDGNGALIQTLKPLSSYFSTFLQDLAQSGHAGKCEVRLFDVIPPVGMIMIDRGSGKGRILVEINGIGAAGAECPGFDMHEHSDGWYGFFATQFDTIWARAQPLQPAATGARSSKIGQTP